MVAAEEFTSYFAAPLVSHGDFVGVLEIFHRQPLSPDQAWFDFLLTVAEQAAIAIRNADQIQNLQRAKSEMEIAYQATLSGWVRALDLRDGETGAHTQRVTAQCVALARAMHYPPNLIPSLWRGAMLHDIGKMAIPDSILRKPGALSEDEWAVMKTHPALARDLLAPIEFLRSAIDIPYYHHEKWDGSGYPEGLAGVHIPLEARIFAVADVWDALRSDRPYRAAWSDQQALDHIGEQKGKAFDPNVVDVFEQMIAAGTAAGDST
jgi:HD-GYP domain-containing protein (c-di-GMP phosphodiesterase class II)